MSELGSRFAEVERRVRVLVAENQGLRARVRELEAERGRLGEAARESEALRASRTRVQDRLKRLLRLLETIDVREGERAGIEGTPLLSELPDADKL